MTSRIEVKGNPGPIIRNVAGCSNIVVIVNSDDKYTGDRKWFIYNV